jgi:hypothetical protein
MVRHFLLLGVSFVTLNAVSFASSEESDQYVLRRLYARTVWGINQEEDLPLALLPHFNQAKKGEINLSGNPLHPSSLKVLKELSPSSINLSAASVNF